MTSTASPFVRRALRACLAFSLTVDTRVAVAQEGGIDKAIDGFFESAFGWIKLAIDLVRGRYPDPNSRHPGEVSHCQAQATALTGTVGLGNIADVGAALAIGGSGVTCLVLAASFDGAFSAEGVAGGFIGTLIQSLKRATFSDEAGVGSAAITRRSIPPMPCWSSP